VTARESFQRARDLVIAGDVAELARRLATDAALSRSRSSSIASPYDGYFHGATLLHHVAGNPSFGPLSPRTLDVARLLLDAGAEVDAHTLAGPSQPNDFGWTALGLVASSLQARIAGITGALLDLLIERGADVDDRRPSGMVGLPVIGALYYGEPEAAAHLVERGAQVDLPAACGLGRRDLASRFVTSNGQLEPDAYRLAPYTLATRPSSPTREEVLDLCLVFAARGGRTALLGWLVELGADPDREPSFDHGARALHWAAAAGEVDTVERLLEVGADPRLLDETHHATPAQWARHAGHDQLADRLQI